MTEGWRPRRLGLALALLLSPVLGAGSAAAQVEGGSARPQPRPVVAVAEVVEAPRPALRPLARLRPEPVANLMRPRGRPEGVGAAAPADVAAVDGPVAEVAVAAAEAVVTAAPEDVAAESVVAVEPETTVYVPASAPGDILAEMAAIGEGPAVDAPAIAEETAVETALAAGTEATDDFPATVPGIDPVETVLAVETEPTDTPTTLPDDAAETVLAAAAEPTDDSPASVPDDTSAETVLAAATEPARDEAAPLPAASPAPLASPDTPGLAFPPPADPATPPAPPVAFMAASAASLAFPRALSAAPQPMAEDAPAPPAPLPFVSVAPAAPTLSPRRNPALPAAALPPAAEQPRPRTRPAAAPAVTLASAGAVTRGLASSLRPRLRPAVQLRRTVPEQVVPAAIIRPNPGQDAVQGRRGAVCGDPSILGERLAPIPGRLQGCGIADPVRVTSVGGIRLSTPSIMHCETATALKSWIDTGLRPAFGRSEVVELRVAAHYTCRSRNNRPGAAVSEHGRGRAIDIAGFTLANGQSLSVLGDYKGASGAPIRQAHKSACGTFKTTLGPGSDGYHEDHLHLDVAQRKGRGTYCR